ncbi:trfa protein [Ophiostoma piceae UAMH 11346]|uniref:Trfa protein n=1 Tax=Ophiostoma piceae (strain UAMH 11346) TaxID=1262450 RepID=S3BXP9_OPHP1|nr:trfa protein [Ophiostoma piceae UAMH 11346]
MAPVSVPIASRLPSSLRIASANATVIRVMSRLTRPSLLSLALDWLDEQNQALTAPYLKHPAQDGGDDEEPDDFYPPAQTLEDLQDYYADLQTRKGSKREVLDRILEGDWRHGISMYQLAMADLQYLYDHPTSQKWTAFQIVPLKVQRDSETPDGDDHDGVSSILDKASLVVPRFHPSSFLRNLQSQILPDIKVHYNFDRHKIMPLLILRIFILDSPYNTSLATAAASSGETTNVEASRTVYIAFPDASPFVYLSSAQSSSAGGDKAPGGSSGGTTRPSEARSLRSLVVEAIPKALSRPRERYALKPTNLATRNLSELLQRRGAGRTNTAGGGWGIYADEKTIESPLNTVPPPSVASQLEGATTKTTKADEKGAPTKSTKPTKPQKRALSPGARREERLSKRRKKVAAARFGKTARIDDGCGVERVDIIMQDPYPGGGRHQDFRQDEDEVEDRGPRPDHRRKSKGGRRSQIDAVLAREDEDEEADEAQRARRTAGAEGGEEDGDNNTTNNDNEWRPRVAFTFQGPHVFAGIRQLVEAGIIDGEKMPGWMTGEEGVTVGAVRDGRIRGHKGSGMP